ncbi:hypothetical protein FRC11_014243, partial [Ceratobasidium sp. 423]
MPVDAPPDEVILHYNALRTMCFDIVKVLDSTSVKYAHADPALANHLATLEQQTQTEGPGTPSLADMGVQVDLPPSVLPSSTAPLPLPARPAQPATLQENPWTWVTSWHKPRRTPAKPSAAAPKPQPTNSQPANPVRVIADLQ